MPSNASLTLFSYWNSRSFSRASANGCDPDISAGLLLYPVAGPLPAKPAPADLAPGLPSGAVALLMRRR
jgi:hypothetical protein